MSFADFLHLEEERPTHWDTSQARDEVEPMAEDTPVMLGGIPARSAFRSPESCNYKLSGEANISPPIP
jgi:hypothetical protein